VIFSGSTDTDNPLTSRKVPIWTPSTSRRNVWTDVAHAE
jgi:hypothetical protein